MFCYYFTILTIFFIFYNFHSIGCILMQWALSWNLFLQGKMMKLFKWITVDLLILLIIYDLKIFWWLLRWIRKNILIIIFIKLGNNSSMLILLFLIQNLISLTNITRFTTRLQFWNNFKIICNWKAGLIILRGWLLRIIVWIICLIEFLLSLSAVSCSVSISNINQSSFYNCFML